MAGPEQDWTPRDSVDALLASWDERRPDLDFTPVGVLTRLARVRRHVEVELERVFADHALSAPDFAVLATLTRVVGDGVLAPEALSEELGMPAGTLHARVRELARRGLIEDRPDGLALSATARALVDQAIPAHLDNERRVLSALSPAEQDRLSGLLRKLLVEFEGSRPARAAGRLGLTVAPAHMTADVRATVGLAPVTGLLVQSVERDGAGAAVGLRTGDVLVRAGDRELRSVTDIYAALAGGSRAVSVLRGESDVFEVALRLDGSVPAPPATSPGRAAYAEHVL